ncbi:MAG TPA: isoprenylcysteine carboxylmethyltransferase family protein [Gemmatimonadales bacterium]|nr:isoprenylcysteine carboxylmethyltransferase family protein [Gemmatimonadales bacterium]
MAERRWLAIRSLFWVAVLPGVFAGWIPWRYFGLREVRLRPSDPVHLVGLAAIGTGVALFAWCVWEFARRGRGTLSPADPPRALVIQGPYRWVRNPMYLGVTAALLGEVALTGSAALLIYWAVWFLAVNLFIRGYEEPTLRRQFGASFVEFSRTVPRWIPRRPR